MNRNPDLQSPRASTIIGPALKIGAISGMTFYHSLTRTFPFYHSLTRTFPFYHSPTRTFPFELISFSTFNLSILLQFKLILKNLNLLFISKA
jgi:hypothetical protein